MKKLFKILVILLGILFAVFLIVPLFLPTKAVVSRSVVIAVAPKVAFDRVLDLRTWADWDPFSAAEPTAKLVFSGSEKKVGFARRWEGKKIGSGTMTLSVVEEGRRIETTLIFDGEAGTPSASFLFEPVKDGTKVVWNYQQEGLSYPMGRLMGLVMNPMLGGMFEKGLAKLKNVLEKK